MSGLSPEARSIIEAARGGDDPTPQDRTRIRTSLIARVGAGVAAASAATSAGSAAAGATKAAGAGLLAGLVPKSILVLSAVGAIGIGSYVVHTPSISPTTRTPIAVPVVSSSAMAEAEPTPIVNRAEEEEKAPEHEGPSVPTPTAVEVHEDAAPNLAAEVESLREAHTALREGRPDEAMDVLERDAAASDASGLEQERVAMRVFALCRLGETEEARRQAAAFLARWPKSPLAARVSAACVH